MRYVSRFNCVIPVLTMLLCLSVVELAVGQPEQVVKGFAVNSDWKMRRQEVTQKIDAVLKRFQNLFPGKPTNELTINKLRELLNHEDYYVRIIACLTLSARTQKKYPIVKRGEDWSSLVTELLRDLDVVTTNVPDYGFINVEANTIVGFLSAIGEDVVPEIIKSLEDKTKSKSFRIKMLFVLQNIKDRRAVPPALRIIEGDDYLLVKKHAVRTLARVENQDKINQLRNIVKKNKDLRRAAILELERLASEGEDKASGVLKEIGVE